jgi:hypothetical protein
VRTLFLTAIRVAALAPLALIGAGCAGAASKSAGVAVGGKVTHDGKPVANATVTFYREAGEEVASATTDPNGVFKLPAGADGVPPGSYKATVTAGESEGEGDEAAGKRQGAARLPAQYASSEETPLTAQVTGAGPNEFHFELSARGQGR